MGRRIKGIISSLPEGIQGEDRERGMAGGQYIMAYNSTELNEKLRCVNALSSQCPGGYNGPKGYSRVPARDRTSFPQGLEHDGTLVFTKVAN